MNILFFVQIKCVTEKECKDATDLFTKCEGGTCKLAYFFTLKSIKIKRNILKTQNPIHSRASDCSSVNNGDGVCADGYECYHNGQCKKVRITKFMFHLKILKPHNLYF